MTTYSSSARRRSQAFTLFLTQWLFLVSLLTGARQAAAVAEREARAKTGADQEAWSSIDAGRSTKGRDEAERLFQRAEQHAKSSGDTWAQAAAVNRRAMLAASAGQTDEAIALLKPLPIAPDDPEAFVFKYNLGQILEQKKDASGALDAYEASLALRPDFTSAKRRFYALLFKAEPDIPRAIRFNELLMRQGQAALLNGPLLDLLEKWGADAKAPDLFVQLARVYAAGGCSAEQFKASDESRVRAVGEKYAPLKKLSEQLIEAFEKQSPNVSAWQDAQGRQTAMSRLLVSLADIDLRAEPQRIEAAVARYEAALRVDPENTTASVGYAGLLAQYGKKVEGFNTKLEKFLEEMMSEKGRLYNLANKSRADWVNLLRMHTILAGICEENPELARRGTLYTSIYHWTRATEIQETIRKTVDRSYPISPRLYLSLADAQSRERRLTEAWDSYVQAAAVCAANDKSVGLRAIKSAQDAATKLELDPRQIKKFNDASDHVLGLSDTSAQQGATLPVGARWLPPEYKSSNLTDEQINKLGEVNEKYERQMQETPLKSGQIAKERTRELDNLLDPAQREQVNKARASRTAKGQ